jgi:hypothetical protein
LATGKKKEQKGQVQEIAAGSARGLGRKMHL